MTVTGRTSRHRTKWATSQSGRSRARGTCVLGIIFMRKDGNCRSIVSEVVRQRVVVQFGSTCNLAEWAISTGGRSQARGTCVRGNISMRMDGNLTVDRVRGGASESCRTIRLHLPLNRVGDFDRRKVSSTRYMCPWEHFHAYGREFVGRSCPRWCIRELSYNSSPPAT